MSFYSEILENRNTFYTLIYLVLRGKKIDRLKTHFWTIHEGYPQLFLNHFLKNWLLLQIYEQIYRKIAKIFWNGAFGAEIESFTY